MPITIGYIHTGGEDLYTRVFYDSTFMPGAGQTYLDAPLIDNQDPALGPTGFCLVVVNTTGERADATVYGANGALLVDHVRVPVGNPVTAGQGRSRTVAQLVTLGWRKRGDVGQISME